MNGGTIRRVTGRKIGKMTGTGTIRRIVRVNGTIMRVPIWCGGVAGSNPSLNQQSKDKVKLMIDSGSQSTACSVDFAKGYATDDTERAKLWDIQDQKIEAHGKKIVDVKFHGQANETPVPASIKLGRVRCCEKCCLDGQIVESWIRSALHESRPHLLDGKWRIENNDQ